jgi:hypothetical protein
MDGPWGIDNKPKFKDTVKQLLAIAFPILLTILMLWLFGRL